MTRAGVAAWSIGALLMLTACGGVETRTDNGPQSDGSADRSQSGSSDEVAASALDDMENPAFPDPLIDPADVRSGGPPPDGIPPIDEPTFERAASVDWLEPDEPVLSLTAGEETRAYPLRVMTWHEIVNDRVGGLPLAVTYCPLCNSGVAFEREVDGQLLTFGTSGRLYQDNLVMYDRQSESLWPQLTGQASIGTRTGEQLVAIPIGTVTWRDFLAAHPEASVLSQDTGFDRPYGENPYVGYDEADGSLLFELDEDLDDRLLVKERVIGLSGPANEGRETSSVAYVRSALIDQDPVTIQVGGSPVVLWHQPGQNSALDTRQISEGEDVGTVSVFDPEIDGQELIFERRGALIVDEQTGSTWDALGRATSGEFEGASLLPVTHLDTFWFSWVLFHPDTSIEGN